MYDQACYDLANSFLADQPKAEEKDREELAQMIQDTIEDYLMRFTSHLPADGG